MEGRRTIRSLRLSNFLSFGPDAPEIPLEPLNVLIGANGSGKSNFLAAFDVLKAIPTDLSAPFRRGGGGFESWVWNGGPAQEIEIEANLDLSQFFPAYSEFLVSHAVRFGKFSLGVLVTAERIEEAPDKDGTLGTVFYDRDGSERIKVPGHLGTSSVLSWLSDPIAHTEIYSVKSIYSQIRLFRDWSFGADSPLRRQQRVDQPQAFPAEDFSNLFLVFNDLRTKPGVWRKVQERVRAIYDSVRDVLTAVEGGAVSLYLEEEGGGVFSSHRLSDGTLRYLALIAILTHPSPPPVVILEEPELGLHPDLIRSVAEMLVEASERTQLIVTTHSADLIDAIQLYPEAVMVFERDAEGTRCSRLSPERLEKWLERYKLGELWRSGEIGGNRW